MEAEKRQINQASDSLVTFKWSVILNVFYKPCDLIGSGSGRYPMSNESSITSLASLQIVINYKYIYPLNPFFIASTNFDMDSDESHHRKSEFYNP